MTSFYDAFTPAPRPAPTTPAPVQAVSADRAGRYALAAFVQEVDAVRFCGEGGRNHQLNTSAYKLARFVGAGDLSRGDVENALTEAALAAGLEPAEIAKTLASALTSGTENERIIPDREEDIWSPDYGRNSPTSVPTSPTPSTGSSPGSAHSTSASTPSTTGSVSPSPMTAHGSTPPNASLNDWTSEAGIFRDAFTKSSDESGTSVTTSPPSTSTPDGSTEPFTNSQPSSSAVSVGSSESLPPEPPSTSVETPSPVSPSAPPDPLAWITDLTLKAAVHDTLRRREATRIAREIEWLAEFREPASTSTLVEELALPHDEAPWLVEQLIPEGGNVLLTAQYKAGKTTLVSNLARAMADGRPFLGRFEVAPLDGRVAIFNYEVERSQYARWLGDIGFEHPDRVAVLNLRGHRLPMTVPAVQEWVIRWLVEREVRVWIVDPFAPAYGGDSENDNAEVSRFLNTLDVIQERAGVRSLILPAHTGRPSADEAAQPERVRGATRLDDWADTRWLLARDGDRRFFSATGRDVEVPEGALEFNPLSRSLSYTAGTRYEIARTRNDELLGEIVRQHPGASKTDLAKFLGDRGGPKQKTKALAAIEGAIERKVIRVDSAGQTHRHFPVGAYGETETPDHFA